MDVGKESRTLHFRIWGGCFYLQVHFAPWHAMGCLSSFHLAGHNVGGMGWHGVVAEWERSSIGPRMGQRMGTEQGVPHGWPTLISAIRRTKRGFAAVPPLATFVCILLFPLCALQGAITLGNIGCVTHAWLSVVAWPPLPCWSVKCAWVIPPWYAGWCCV